MIKALQKVGILFFKKEKEKIFKCLRKNKCFHVIEIRKTKESLPQLIEIQKKIADAKYVLDFLEYFRKKREKKKSLKEKIRKILILEKIPVKEEEIKKKIEKLNLDQIVKECEEIEAQFIELEKKEKELEEKKLVYEEWEDLPYVLSKIKETKNLGVFCGKVKNLDLFEKELKKETSLYEIKTLSSLRKEKERKICLFYYLPEKEKIEKILKKFEAKEEKEIKEISFLPQKEIEKIKRETEELFKKQEKLFQKVNEIWQKYEIDLKIAFDYFNCKKRKIEIELGSLKGDLMMLIVGWIDESKIEDFKKDLEKLTKNFEIFKMKLEKGEEPPVLIENKNIIAPGEVLLDIYGMPKPKETNPVPFMTPFFVLFFGFCLGDLGYGLIMTFLSLFLIKILKISKKEKKALYLLLYCGISTTIMGMIFGSFFGMEIKKIQVLNLLKNPLLGLIVALYLGIFQILFGLMIKMYIKIKNKMIKSTFLDELPWIYFLSSLTLFSFWKSDFLKYMVLFGAFLIVLTQSRKGKNIFLKPLSGILALYDIIPYFSDTLSYARLLALGLSTAVIASVVNLTAQILQKMIPVLGLLISILILVGGHLFNLIISSLGAFIHSMRLQFVEFLPKFMEGGGKKFTPFSCEGKYVKVIKGREELNF